MPIDFEHFQKEEIKRLCQGGPSRPIDVYIKPPAGQWQMVQPRPYTQLLRNNSTKAFFFLSAACEIKPGYVIAVGQNPGSAREYWRVQTPDSTSIGGVTIATVEPWPKKFVDQINQKNKGNKESREEGPDPRKVFVVYGRNEFARKALFSFLRSLSLEPLEWHQGLRDTCSGAPYTGEVLDKLFQKAKAVLVLLTGDDVARLRDKFVNSRDPEYEKRPSPQARPNVLFEAGMAFGRAPERTILVELGSVRPFTDISGRQIVRLSNEVAARQALATRLQGIGCDVNLIGTDWHTEGDFDSAIWVVPLPHDLAVIPPAPDVPQHLAKYSGRWEGVWADQLQHELVVERVTPPSVNVIYAWGDCKAWNTTRSFERRTGELSEDGSLHLEYRRERGDVHVIYRPTADFSELRASYEYAGGTHYAVMRRFPLV